MKRAIPNPVCDPGNQNETNESVHKQAKDKSKVNTPSFYTTSSAKSDADLLGKFSSDHLQNFMALFMTPDYLGKDPDELKWESWNLNQPVPGIERITHFGLPSLDSNSVNTFCVCPVKHTRVLSTYLFRNLVIRDCMKALNQEIKVCCVGTCVDC